MMSDSAGTPGSSNNNTSPSSNNNTSSPPPPAPGSSPSPPAVSPPPPSDNGDGPPPTSTSPPPTLSPPPSPPPPPSSSPPPPASNSSSSPPPSLLSVAKTPLSEAPNASPPPPASTTSPPNSPPPPPPPTPTTGAPANSTSPPPSKQATPPPPDKATPPPPAQATSSPPAPIAASPPSPAIVSPAPNATGVATQASPPPAPILGAPSITNTPPSPARSPPMQNGSISPPTPARSPSGNSSRASPGGAPSNSEVSSNSMAQASNGDGHRSTTVMATSVAVGCAVLFSLIAIFLFVSSRKKRKDRAYPPHYLPPKSCNVQTYGFFCGQQQASPGFSGPQNYSYVTQNQNSPLGDSNGSQRNNMYSPDSGVFGGSKAFFTYEQVMEITNGFAQQNIIGEGGFGCVYKGSTQDGKIVAVKQLRAGSGQGDREFKAEVEIISRVHHRHLVSLVGYSIADNQRLLIYEFVPNNTLEHNLHSKGLPVLDWQKRLKIAIGSAKGLAYLHEDCHPKIIHRDIKSANILLDDDFEAQVADFGLARLNDTTQTHVSTRVMGTFGYLAPEYASSGKLTDRSDVFSFGVVLLELITGRKPVDPTQPLGDESLVEWARPILLRALQTGDLSELVDPRLQNHYVESEMLRMVETAAACVRHSAPKRPRMMQVLRSLDSDSEMSDLSNGVKYGQSTVYDSGQYNQDIMKFRKMALGGDSSEFDNFSGDYTSRNSSGMPSPSDYAIGESETFLTQRGGGASRQKYGL